MRIITLKQLAKFMTTFTFFKVMVSSICMHITGGGARQFKTSMLAKFACFRWLGYLFLMLAPQYLASIEGTSTLFFPVLELEPSHHSEQKVKADDFFAATLFAPAIPFYQIMWRDGKLSSDSEACLEDSTPLRLAYCYACEEKFAEALMVLDEYFFLKKRRQEVPLLQAWFFQGLIYQALQNWEKAQEVFYAILAESRFENSPTSEEVQFALGVTYFLAGKHSEANKLFQALSLSCAEPILRGASRLYLVRMALIHHEYAQAQTLMIQAEADIQGDLCLVKECLYLRGELAYLEKAYLQAASYFQKAVPVDPKKWTKWSLHALYHLGWSYLKAANDLSLAVVLRQKYFDLAEESFKKLVNEERAYLALGQCYLSKASALNDASFYQKAEELLSCTELFISSEAQMQALLLRAEAAPTFSARDKLYSELTLDRDSQSALISRSWYLKGINSFDYASSLFKENRIQESISFFQKAASELKQAFHLMKDFEKKRAASALKLYAQACYFQNQPEARMEAFRACENLIHTYADLFQEMDQPAEVYYLRGLFAAQISRLDHQEEFNTAAIASLSENLSLFSENSYADAARYLLGFLYQEKKEYGKAREYFTFLVEQCPNSKYAGEALFASALCADYLGDREEGKKIKLNLLEKYPKCKRAADAYLALYDFQEYLQGDKDALKHLVDFKDKYPSSPWLLHVNFLIGLDCKRDRKTASGKWIRQKNLKEAIDAFQAVETFFHQFQAQKCISEDAYPAALNLYYKAKLERALANLAIAEASQGAKKVIYSEYAIQVFREIKSEIEKNQHLEILAPGNPFPFFQEEYLFGLAQAYLKAGDGSAAEKEFKEMIEKYKGAKITRGYYLSRLWYEKGMLAQKEQRFEDAMHFFALAEDAGKGKVLTSEQKLSLWLEQSKCCQRLNQLDEAMLLLSKVINSDVASGLRLQAMFFRAEVYELQGRYELAMKQLETIVKKGGDWSFKAQKKLEEEYGIE
ncbi:MAG: hypothetical protein CK425_05245 [Parachlamydia sp.]|nr:MAG: hypothetical protein CK425_05245 [Parachlamydia sp.]